MPAPQDFVPEECDLSLAAQKRLALIQPLLDVDAITDRQLRLSIARDIFDQFPSRIRVLLNQHHVVCRPQREPFCGEIERFNCPFVGFVDINLPIF